MFRVYAATVRSTYLLMVVGALAVGGWALLEFWTAFQRPGRSGRLDGQTLVIIAFLLAYVLPATRAAIRLLRFRELVPDAHLRERPAVATVVVIPAVLGLLLLYLVIRALIDILPWGAEDVGGPIGGALMLAVLLHVFALLTAEIVLIGRPKPKPT